VWCKYSHGKAHAELLYGMGIHFASIISKKFQKNSVIFPEKSVFFMPWEATFLRFNVHQDNIRPNAANAVPGNAVIVFSSKQSKDPARPWHDDGTDHTFRHFHQHITDKSQTPTI
jgi:hypothetical protein